MLVNGYETGACESVTHQFPSDIASGNIKSMWSITCGNASSNASVDSDARCGYAIRFFFTQCAFNSWYNKHFKHVLYKYIRLNKLELFYFSAFNKWLKQNRTTFSPFQTIWQSGMKITFIHFPFMMPSNLVTGNLKISREKNLLNGHQIW